MARTAIAIQAVNDNTAATLAYAAADSANGMTMPGNTGHEEILVKNASGSPVTVTARSVACSHGRTGDVALTIAAGAEGILGPFSPLIFNQSDGSLSVDFSVSASITVACRRGQFAN